MEHMRHLVTKLFPTTLLGLTSIILGLTSNISSSQAANGCGPEGKGLLVPDGPFQEACNNHDKCYEEKNLSQEQCDQKMHREMVAICNRKYSRLNPFRLSCKAQAKVYHEAVSEWGETSYKDGASGKIINVSSKRINNRLSDDEFKSCVTFENDGRINTEYFIRLYSAKGKLIDTEPDANEENVKIGRQKTICVGTEGKYASIEDLGKKFTVKLWADDPKKDFIVVDSQSNPTP